MADHPANSIRESDVGDPRADDEKALQELRSILLSAEHGELVALRQRLDDLQMRARDMGAAIAEAIRLRREQGGGPDLREALGPSVEDVLRESVRKNPDILASALFPIMGPAIRRSIFESIRQMVESFNESLEKSFSIQGIKWRIEAIRTGRPFAEVVLLRSLVYRVEQVFLIHKKTSLLLLHEVAPYVSTQDPEMVSGMLSAIQDFVRDSFSTPQAETLDSLQVGDLQVWVEQGPGAILAAVIRGHAPQDLRVTLREKMEALHARFSQELDDFEGDAAPFEAFRSELIECLAARYRTEKRSKARPFAAILGLAIVAVLLVWALFSFSENRKWGRFVGELQQQPGIVVTSFSKEGGRYRISGLRDPLSEEPAALLTAQGLDPGRAEFHWGAYYALDDSLVERRASTILEPPAGVTLSVERGTLRAVGKCSPEWASKLRESIALIPGVQSLDESRLDDGGSLASLKAALESATVLFDVGEVAISGEQRVALDQVRARLQTLVEKAATQSQEVAVEIVGHADTTGEEDVNQVLSERRAQRVARELAAAGIPAVTISARGVGTSEPVRSENTEEDRKYNRSATFRVSFSRKSSTR
jgi:outer membrane protein OmpA-like peptidoglycan-associated protein